MARHSPFSTQIQTIVFVDVVQRVGIMGESPAAIVLLLPSYLVCVTHSGPLSSD